MISCQKSLVGYVWNLSTKVMMFTLRWYLLINIIAFSFAAIDKTCAKLRISRISEKTLLFLAAFGGFIGELVAFRIFNHKTRKAAFHQSFALAVVAHVVLIYYFW